MGTSDNDGYIAKEFVICVIDILGQRDLLRHWAHLPADGKCTAQFLDAVKRTAGTVEKLRAMFRDMFEPMITRSSSPAAFQSLTEKQKGIFERCRNCDLTTQQFSDTLLFYSPLRNDEGDIAPFPIYAMITAAGAMLRLAIAAKTPFRGAITVGTGIKLKHGDLYGPALAEAHYLESEVAQWPRIVVSRRLTELLVSKSQHSRDALMNRVISGMGGVTANLLCDDWDGQKIVDFLGPGMKTIVSENAFDERQTVKNSYDFVCNETSTFLNDGNQKLYSRYAALRNYMAPRLKHWR